MREHRQRYQWNKDLIKNGYIKFYIRDDKENILFLEIADTTSVQTLFFNVSMLFELFLITFILKL